MHIYVRNIFRIALWAVVLPFMTACSDDDLVINEEPDEEAEIVPLSDVLADKLVTTFVKSILRGRWKFLLPGGARHLKRRFLTNCHAL